MGVGGCLTEISHQSSLYWEAGAGSLEPQPSHWILSKVAGILDRGPIPRKDRNSEKLSPCLSETVAQEQHSLHAFGLSPTLSKPQPPARTGRGTVR